MIQGVIFDFDNTIYNYELCNDYGLKKIFEYISLKYSIDISVIKDNYNKINQNIKKSNNCANKFNKVIYFKQLIENLFIELKELDNILNLYEHEFNSKISLFDGFYELILLFKKLNIINLLLNYQKSILLKTLL
jgi:beta-phosphoglucomutase-like phosphatase (HAD superfamily)